MTIWSPGTRPLVKRISAGDIWRVNSPRDPPYDRSYLMWLMGDCKSLINVLQAINPFYAPSLISDNFRT